MCSDTLMLFEVSHLCHRDALGHGRLQIGVIRADAGRDDQLQLRRLLEPLGRHVGRPERLRDDDVRIGELLLELTAGTILIGCHYESVAARLQELAQTQRTRDAAEKLPRFEIDRLRCRRGLSAWIALDPGNLIPRVVFRIARLGILVKHADDLAHGQALVKSSSCSEDSFRLGRVSGDQVHQRW